MQRIFYVPQPAVNWLQRQRKKPVIGPVISSVAPLLRRRTNVVAHGQAAGLRINPHGARGSYALGTAEPLVQDALAAHVHEGDVVWDVGANVGFFTLLAARLVGSGTVFAFEPLALNASAIRDNCRRNGMVNVNVLEVALSDYEGDGELQLYGDQTWAKLDTSADTTFKSDRNVADVCAVPISTLDRQLDSLTAPNLVKIDIEGAEVAALRGAERLLSEHRPTIICELHGTNAGVSELLERHGYRLSTLETPGVHPRDAEWSVHMLAVAPTA